MAYSVHYNSMGESIYNSMGESIYNSMGEFIYTTPWVSSFITPRREWMGIKSNIIIIITI